MAPKRKGPQKEASGEPAKKQKAAAAGNDASSAAAGVIGRFGLVWDQGGDIEVLPGLKALLYLHPGPNSCLDGSSGNDIVKVAGFDIDCTIITTKSGKTFAKDASDWKLLYDCVPKRLCDLSEAGYTLVFFTNQAGMEKKKTTPQQFQQKIAKILDALDVPVLVFAATGTNHFRKPSTEMWKFMLKNCHKSAKVDLASCVYVGDAAGRAKNWSPGKPKDFSCTDRMFAFNIGVPFYTPEEFFLNQKPAPFEWHSIDPRAYLEAHPPPPLPRKGYASLTQEMVLMVGMPASGKSTFCRRHFEPAGYVVVNRDTLKTPVRCAKAAEEALASGRSVVIDNTNASAAERKAYVDLAKKHGVGTVRCFVLSTPAEMAHHLNLVRQNASRGAIRRIPDVAYNVFKKNFEDPSEKKEGFAEVARLPFSPCFDSDEMRALFSQWTE